MRIPWGTPTVSDSSKLSPVKHLDPPLTLSQLYELQHQLALSDDFDDFDDWNVSQSTPGNVSVSSGVVSIVGSGAWNVNGIIRKVGITRAEGYFEYKSQRGAALSNVIAGVHSAGTLSNSPRAIFVRDTNANKFVASGMGVSTGAGNMNVTVTQDDTWYTLRTEVLKSVDGTFGTCRHYISGGEFTTPLLIGHSFLSGNAWAATLYYLFQVYSNGVILPFKEWRWYSGYATDGPTLTYVADAGAGQSFATIDWTNIAAVGGWSTTNAKFKRSIDSGVANYNPSWLSLAELRAFGSESGNRNVRLMGQANSDGATQQYIGELNADDAVTLIVPNQTRVISSRRG